MEVISLVIRQSCEDTHPENGICICKTIYHDIYDNEKNMIKDIQNIFIKEVKDFLKFRQMKDDCEISELIGNYYLDYDENSKIIPFGNKFKYLFYLEEMFNKFYEDNYHLSINFLIKRKKIKINLND